MFSIRPWGQSILSDNDFRPLYWLIILLCSRAGRQITIGRPGSDCGKRERLQWGCSWSTCRAPSSYIRCYWRGPNTASSKCYQHPTGECLQSGCIKQYQAWMWSLQKTFSRKDHLRRHITLHDGKNCRCHICGKLYQTSFQLRRHTDAAHHGIRQQCATCEKFFAYKHDFVMHVQGHIGDNSSYKCTVCGKAIPKQSFLNDHMNKHFATKPHGCRKCGQLFASKSTLNHHDKIYGLLKHSAKCKTCDKIFKSIKYLREHKKTIHGSSKKGM